MGRNIFRDTGFRNVDFTIAKNWKFGERFGAQFRAEFFQYFQSSQLCQSVLVDKNGYAHNDPSAGGFGCGCATPDVAARQPYYRFGRALEPFSWV